MLLYFQSNGFFCMKYGIDDILMASFVVDLVRWFLWSLFLGLKN